MVFELRDGWARPAQGIERLTGIVEGFGKLGFLGEEAATGVLLSQLLVENGQTNEAMARLTRAEGPAMSVGDRYLRGVAAWARADAIAQEAMELYGGMEPVTRRRYDNRIEEAWKALDEAGAPEAALHSRQPGRLSPRLVLPLSHLWYLREF